MIQAYFKNGKGKTTAAVGISLLTKAYNKMLFEDAKGILSRKGIEF